MSTSTSEISNLAKILHQNGDKVLNSFSKLSLNAVILQKLNQEFESLIDSAPENEGSFQVIASSNGNSQLLEDLHFLHDFMQKTIGLKLTNSASLSLLNNKIDISKFKSIKYLEIRKIPIKEVTGLKNVQSQLESIICTRCLSMLEELLAECGGDNSSGFVWSELKEAVLSFNNIKTVDTSIALAPWLQVLDLSHNQISDVKAVECLPNLKYINLSFNCLDAIPVFNKSARKKIELLVINNNYIEHLTGLNGLCHLIELDLSNNWVSTTDSLSSLLSISTLQWLSLAGNPISCHQNYRKSVAGFLHISASFSNFYLDKIQLSKKEKDVVGIKLYDNISSSNKPILQKVSTHSLKSKSSDEYNVNEQSSLNSRKSGKARLVAIPNLDDGTYEEAINDCNNYFMRSSTEHLITKKRIENTRSAYGIDNWLVQGSSVVQDILGLPPVQVSTSTPYDDLCLQAALDSIKNVVTTTAVIENHQEPEVEACDKSNVNSVFTCNDETANSVFLENVDEKNESMKSAEVKECEIEEKPDPFSKEVSPDIEKIQEEEVDIDENEKLFVVIKETKDYNNEIKQEELFLTLTETELQEREPTRGKIVAKWSLSSLESCVKLKPNQLQFGFDTVRRDKKERTYSLEEQEATTLYKQISEILESRTLSDMNQVVYKCENCSSQFSREMKFNKPDRSNWCPLCGSKFILQLNEVPLPASFVEKKINETKTSKNPDAKVSHNRSSSAGGFFQSFLKQNEEEAFKSSSQSSIDNTPSQSDEALKSKGSAASLDELNELPTIQFNNVKRSDSDIEILSNPSQSSIEVIDGPGRHSGSTPRRKRSSEERQLITPAAIAAATALIQGSNPTGLTESSSSGSITDSICTAYESGSIVPIVANKSELSKEESVKSNIITQHSNSIFQEQMKKVKMEIKRKETIRLVNYSYSDFKNLDHRIKFFLYTHVFEDATEEFSFGLRAFVVPSTADSGFPSCIVASDKKLYFLKVTNCEHGDDARNFLQKTNSLIFNLNDVKCIYTLTWYQGLGMKIILENNKTIQYLILLKDPSRTKNFLSFLISKDIRGLHNFEVIEEALQRPYMSMQHVLLSSAFLEDSSIQYFCLFDYGSVTTLSNSDEIKIGGLLMNYTELLLFADKLHWLFDGSELPPNPQFCQKFKNLMQVSSYKLTMFFQFFNGAEEKEVWRITMDTVEAAETLIKFLREAWEKIFLVPLQISSS